MKEIKRAIHDYDTITITIYYFSQYLRHLLLYVLSFVGNNQDVK